MGDPDLIADQPRFRQVAKRYRELAPIVERSRELRTRRSDLDVAKEMLPDAAGDERDILRAEIDAAETAIAQLTDELRILLVPADPNDERNVIVEIRGAEGGEEANLFARDLYEMYRAFAARQGWSVDVLGSDPSDLGGLNEVTFAIEGDSVWARMHLEAGTHRVQRVPVTETQGRIHTSACTVAVMPEADEIADVVLNPAELRVDTFRASGAGGQHVNKTDSAVRVTHLPSGIVVECQDDRSQHKNRARALAILAARIKDRQIREQQAKTAATRKSLIGSGDRSERIRTYNFPQGRVTDHRINLTLYKIDRIMDGEIDELIAALAAEHQAEQLAQLAEDTQPA
ncbi:MAG: peptide chain release factor 1 [Steroidobacteraceae bacterium]